MGPCNSTCPSPRSLGKTPPLNCLPLLGHLLLPLLHHPAPSCGGPPTGATARRICPLPASWQAGASRANREYADFWKNLHHWQKFYTAAGSDGSDKYHLC